MTIFNHFIGQQCIKLDTVDSTNNYTAKLLEATKVEEGTVILADYQSSGKGMRGAVWESKPGENLLFSIVLYPKFLTLNEQFYLSKIVAVAICEALSEYVENVKVKWPNDVYVDGKKISGVLIENLAEGSKLKQSIVGIGINVNQEEGLFKRATSLKMVLGKEIDKDEVRKVVSEKLSALYFLLQRKSFAQIDTLYHKHLLYLDEFRMYFKETGEEFEAKIVNVGVDGRLNMETKKGQIEAFDLKEISFYPSQI